MSRGNLYHLLHFIPAVEAWEMPPALERAAQRLVASGRLRINADAQRNFVRYGAAELDLTFTARELLDPALAPAKLQRLARLVAPAQGMSGLEDLIATLNRELAKTGGIAPDKELKVARVLVQSAHPAVIQLVLESGAELFVSYAHNLGDLVAVHHWQTHGLNSGMQATEREALRIFVSCGGDPFFEGTHKTYTTDGFPALARMMVIAAQELGHFADLLHRGGQVAGRHSMSAEALQRRRSDLAAVASLRQRSQTPAFLRLLSAEHHRAFASKHHRFGLRWAFAWMRWTLCALAWRAPMKLRTHPQQPRAQSWQMFLDDMAFNLTPQADVYRRADPAEEEAIACIEAVARVPQQAAKWGHEAVAAAWPSLYPFYYGPVIAGCRAVLTQPAPANNIPFLQKFMIGLRHALRRRPGYYPE